MNTPLSLERVALLRASARRFALLLWCSAALAPSLGAAETVLVQMSSAMRYRIPATSAEDATWMARAFADAAWTAGTYGVGYDAGAMIKTTVATTAHAVYTRARFTLSDLAAVETVWLGVDYDDGYVAWINGKEVARGNFTGVPAFDSDAASSHESSNGATPNYDPYLDITSLALPVLTAGENVLAIGVWNPSGTSTDLALVPHLSINRPVAPPGEVHWTLAGSPYQVSTTLTIPRGTVLTIDPGVVVRVSPGASIDVAGQILAEGTAAQMITFERQGASGVWGGLRIRYGGDGVVRRSAVRYAKLTDASTLLDIDATGNSEVLIEECDLDNWTNVAVHWDNGSNALRITHCRMGMNTPAALQSHEVVNGYRSNAVLEYSVIGPRLGYNDQIDLGNTKWGGPVPTVQYNELHGGQDDAIDFDNCDGYIIGNFIHGHRPPANGPKEPGCPQYPIGGGGVNGGGLSGNEGSRPFAMNNIIYDCYQGIGYKNGAQPTLINNTIVGCTWGVVLFSEQDIANPALAHGLLVNNVIWDCQIPIKLSWCDQDPKSLADVSHCFVPGGWPGAGNINSSESPLAVTPDKANPRREQFRLRACAQPVDAGQAGPVAQTFHTENVPVVDALLNPRVDMASVADGGTGSPTFYDMGALEYQGPDDCGPPPPARFLRGDANGDGGLDISDALETLFVLYGGMISNCNDALDANDDGQLNTADVIRILEYLFVSGPALPQPFPAAGPDPSDTDSLDCHRS